MSEAWVREQLACSPGAVFESLKAGVRMDVEARQTQRSPTERTERAYRFVGNGVSFTVVLEGNQLHHAVSFTLTNGAIVVRLDDVVTLEGHAVAGDDGACQVRVGADDLALWQFRKRALSALFFTL